MLENIHWLGHASFKIKNPKGKIIYIDPWKLPEGSEQADLILITHEHYDHLSSEDIEKIKKEETEIIIPENCIEKVSGNIKGVKPGDILETQGITIEVVPAYNTNKEFHTKDKGWVGYIIKADGQRIYHAGDTDLIPEMEKIKTDVALLPVSGTYVMAPSEASQAVKLIKPKVAIPMHYGDIVGTIEDAEKFAKEADSEVKILEKE